MTNDSLTHISGPAAFEVLRHRLSGEGLFSPFQFFEEPICSRLASALEKVEQEGPGHPSPLDIAILTRQFLRYQELQLQGNATPSLKIQSGPRWPSESDWKRVGVDARQFPDGFIVRVLPWRPSWLKDVSMTGVDGASAGEFPRRPDDSIPGDPFLMRFHRECYHSLGQQSAVRAALTMPAGFTLLVCLPTGDGKSFIFQLVSEIGFGDAPAGVTLVVTPTVALALDHERAAHELGLPGERLAYRGGDTSGWNRNIIEGIANGTQHLCFASPEAVCGPLQPALMQAAKDGLLRALVVDEAHLVETWGANFRSEFQLLAGIRRSLLQNTTGPTLRTYLLSATVTEETVTTLRALFGDGNAEQGRFRVYAAQRLRPEIEYWVAPVCKKEVQQLWVLEAVLHLPRPAILYVTERQDAKRWLLQLRGQGLHRIAQLTGETPTEERQKVVESWCQGDLDIVVGTSAFGLGIDNPHVRAVIHACVPETLDRLYQEAGRGGRDGRASISLVIPTQEDIKMAYSLNHPKLITVNVGFERWKGMFDHPDHTYDINTDTHILRLDVPPGVDVGRIDMVSERSTEWNARTLILMASAGMINILGSEQRVHSDLASEDGESSPSNAPYHPRLVVKILEPRHLDRSIWEQTVEEQRSRLEIASRTNLQRMINHLHPRKCVAELFAALYELNELSLGDDSVVSVRVAHSCGGCPYCRATGRQVYHNSVQEHSFPWPGWSVTRGTAARILDEGNRVLVFYTKSPEEWRPNERRRFLDGLALFLKSSGIHNIIAPNGTALDLVALQERIPFQPLFTSGRLTLHGLPPGPAVVVLSGDEGVPKSLLTQREPTDARFIFVSEQAMDPSNPNVPLRLRHAGRQLTLDQFLWEIEQ